MWQEGCWLSWLPRLPSIHAHTCVHLLCMYGGAALAARSRMVCPAEYTCDAAAIAGRFRQCFLYYCCPSIIKLRCCSSCSCRYVDYNGGAHAHTHACTFAHLMALDRPTTMPMRVPMLMWMLPPPPPVPLSLPMCACADGWVCNQA